MSVMASHSERGSAPTGSFIYSERQGECGKRLPAQAGCRLTEANPKPNAISPTALTQLLETADFALDDDPAKARHCIAHALQLLRPVIPATSAVDTAQPRGGLAPWQIRKLIAHIKTHTGDEICGRDLARMVGLSTSHFIRAFKTSFGETPHSYVISQRLFKAQAMMLETREPLASIAELPAASPTRRISAVASDRPPAFHRRTGVSRAGKRRACKRLSRSEKAAG